MVTRIGGSRRKSRSKLSKSPRNRGKMSIQRFLQQFNVDDNVALVAEPSHQNGLYHARFHGKIGKVAGSQGRCYKVAIKDGNKKKTMIVHPVHLKKV
jgi:large subunit ribosomal protein L21e